MKELQDEVSVSMILEPGTYIIRIESGIFSSGTNSDEEGEPIVLLWIYGGKVINQKTNVEAQTTWSSLNGYDDTLTLNVLEASTLCAFFFDTRLSGVYLSDRETEITLTAVQI
ncbi:MAG: hypothetical protein KME15_12555 [Drouetiella hepatica Uher 2000/2452]|uniref:Uncharacterized protein n=1 Tax=Drouetiella hepatica Uher 2000/2452 TaxID=904376 RepID=A0A951QCQ6_9CYAN|nr:hypothetical protein [Drouetiella hepatica Uher 2000/2452]